MTDLQDLHHLSTKISNTERMPVLFLGHGSPIHAIEARESFNNYLLNGNYQLLINYEKQSKTF